MKKAIIAIIMLMLCSAFVLALRNPAAAYCTALGYTYTVENTAEGDLGLCKISETKTIDAWQFLQGNEGIRYNYCSKQGYETKIVNDPAKCSKFLTESCAVCITKDKDKKEVEVTELMGITFAETTCGDGSCGYPEDDKTCPADCEGKMPTLPEVTAETEENLSEAFNFNAVFLIVSVVVLLGAGVYWLFRRMKKKSKKK